LPEEKEALAIVFPSIVTDELHIQFFDAPYQQNIVCSIHSLTGQTMLDYPIPEGQNEYRLRLDALPQGTYIYTIKLDGRVVQSGKVVVMK
jgi:hypothetical protein